MTTKSKLNLTELKARLAHMQESLWERREHTDLRWQNKYWYTEKRKLTEEEWKWIKSIAPMFLVEPVNACMGFNFGLNFYWTMDLDAAEMGLSPDDAATFAEAHKLKAPRPEVVLSVTGKHLDIRFDEAWKKMSPLSHNKANEALIKKYHFPELREAAHYDY